MKLKQLLVICFFLTTPHACHSMSKLKAIGPTLKFTGVQIRHHSIETILEHFDQEPDCGNQALDLFLKKSTVEEKIKFMNNLDSHLKQKNVYVKRPNFNNYLVYSTMMETFWEKRIAVLNQKLESSQKKEKLQLIGLAYVLERCYYFYYKPR